MRLHFATIPVHDPSQAAAELDAFLTTHRVVAVDRELIHDGARSVWAVCVSWIDGPERKSAPSTRGQIDWKEVLGPEDFAVFARLRSLRKDLAQTHGVPLYAIFTNDQLAAMVQRGVTTLADLGAIEGVGPSRVERFGRSFLDALAADPSTRGAADAAP